jgi:adenosylmethionine-8-amino-7-oxononanoate aminotransferase
MTSSPHDLRQLAADHLWGQFSRLDPGDGAVPIMERGEGCYIWDTDGKRYLDGLSGLFTVQIGHGRAELAAAAGAQGEKLAYFPLWTYAHPNAIELAARLAHLAPGDLNRVFFTTGGGEAVESAWKLARQYFKMIGQPGRIKAVGRYLAYHGTTMGALAITGIPGFREPFEPLTPGATHAANTNAYRCHFCAAAGEGCNLACADDIEEVILREGPDTVAAVFLEPVQNAGGCFTPADGYFQRVREICDRYGVLLVSDETICAFGRLGSMFACERLGYQPDIITSAKGLTSGYSPLGCMIVSDRIAEPFMAPGASFMHGYTFAGHPVSTAVAMANLDIMEDEKIIEGVREHEGAFRASLETLRDLRIVGDIRGMGFFYGIEMVKDPVTKETFSPEEGELLLRGFLSKRLLELGLICRSDDRGDPVIQLSPPLIARQEQFDEITSILRTALTEAMDLLGMDHGTGPAPVAVTDPALAR